MTIVSCHRLTSLSARYLIKPATWRTKLSLAEVCSCTALLLCAESLLGVQIMSEEEQRPDYFVSHVRSPALRLLLWLSCNEGATWCCGWLATRGSGCAMTGLLCAVLGGTSEALCRLPGSALARSWTGARRRYSQGALLSPCYVLLLWDGQSWLPGRQTGALLGVRGESAPLVIAATI